MKITEIEAIPVSIPLKTDFGISGGVQTMAEHVIVKLHTDEGIVGLGEAATSPQYGEETPESVYYTIKCYLEPALKGADPTNLALLHKIMDSAVHGNTFAKAAIDLAAYDVTGKYLGVPVYTLLGGKFKGKIPVGQSIGIKEPKKAVEEVLEYVKEGFQSIKVKIGNDPEGDVKRVGMIREAIGYDIPLRVDANQGYSPDVAIKTLKAMEKYDLLLVEQPVPRWDLFGMAKVCEALDTPVLADETVYTPEDAINVVRMNAADIINIKIMKPGGLYKSLKIAAIAEAANIPLAIGSMVEMGVGTAAGAHFASACKNVNYPCDVKGPSLMVDDILKEPVIIKDGFTHVPEGPGLGIELDEDKIKKYRMDF